MSNAIQLRDASDVTTFRKNRSLYQNYVQLAAKNTTPIGGIPHNDLMAVARYTATYIPMGSLIPQTISEAACPDCTNNVEYITTEIAAVSCSASCSGSASYQPLIYPTTFKSTKFSY